jgi:hypothetical protein
MIRLMFAGRSEDEIASELGCSVSIVERVLNGGPATEVISRVFSNVLDTVPELAQQAMLAAPAMLERKIWLAENSKDDRVRSTCASDILALVGLAPIKRVSVEVHDADLKEYDGMTLEQIKEKILAELNVTAQTAAPEKPVGETVH